MTCSHSAVWGVVFSPLENPSPKEAAKTSAVWLVSFSCATLTSTLPEAIADRIWYRVKIATRYGRADFCVVDNMAYIGTVIRHGMWCYVVYNNNRQQVRVSKSPGDPPPPPPPPPLPKKSNNSDLV